MKPIDHAIQNFDFFLKKFEEYKAQHLSETDTRSKVLDAILIDVLGWEENDITREGNNDSGYFDYKLSLYNFQFIIEAKRNLIDFSFPVKHKSSSINSLYKGNKAVIDQIRSYILEEGLEYGVITNGHQFIISKFNNTDGTKWKENICVIFHSIEDLKSRFIEFYNLLSKRAVAENKGIFFKQSSSFKKTLFSSFPDREEELIRNELSAAITPIITDVFGEISERYQELEDEKLLQECFISTAETKKNKSEIEKLFADTPPKSENINPVINTENSINQIKEKIFDKKSVEKISAPDPIVIIGGKGSGKTTFINYLFKVKVNKDEKHWRPFIYLDFRKYLPADLLKYKDTIIKDILTSLYANYESLHLHTINVLKNIYHEEIKQNDEGIWAYNKENNIERYNEILSDFLFKNKNDYETHLLKISNYLIKYRKERLCIIIDNADQLAEEIQKEVFILAHSLKLKTNTAVIISLREGYYHKWRYTSPFDAYISNVYHVPAPPYGEVLKKRIDYVINNVEIKDYIKGTYSNKNITISVETVKRFFQNLDFTLFGDSNSEVTKFLEETSYPNIRLGLETFKHFLTSGHTNVTQYIINQNYKIPIWEFVKSVGLDNKIYYQHDRSRIYNLFHPSSSAENLFIKIRLLKFLHDKTAGLGLTKYVSIPEVTSPFISIGYLEKEIILELESLVRNNLIECENYLTDLIVVDLNEENLNIRISYKGFYYLNFLLCRFHYILLILQDTPIYNEEYFGLIKSSFPKTDKNGKQDLLQKKHAVEFFMKYLKGQEDKEINKAFSNDTPNAITFNINNHINNGGLTKDLRRIYHITKTDSTENEFIY